MHSMAWILDRGRDTLFICDLFPPMLLGFACARVCVFVSANYVSFHWINISP